MLKFSPKTLQVWAISSLSLLPSPRQRLSPCIHPPIGNPTSIPDSCATCQGCPFLPVKTLPCLFLAIQASPTNRLKSAQERESQRQTSSWGVLPRASPRGGASSMPSPTACPCPEALEQTWMSPGRGVRSPGAIPLGLGPMSGRRGKGVLCKFCALPAPLCTRDHTEEEVPSLGLGLGLCGSPPPPPTHPLCPRRGSAVGPAGVRLSPQRPPRMRRLPRRRVQSAPGQTLPADARLPGWAALPGAAGAQQFGRRQGGRGQARQPEKARAAGIRPMAPGRGGRNARHARR